MLTSMTLSHDDSGTGPAVVLLHSTVCDRRMWDPLMPVLVESGFRALRCDFRGYGESPMPDRAYNNADDVLELMDSLGIDRAAVIGSSGGGKVALEIASRFPARVTSLSLLCTAMAGHSPSPELEAFGEREDTLLEAGDIDGATELNVATWVGPLASDDVRDRVREMQRHAFEVQLAPSHDVEALRYDFDIAAITAPTLLFSGAHDLIDFREIAVTLAGLIPGARHVTLDWAGHLPSLEAPNRLLPHLLPLPRP